jgi:hypothetical protein
MEIQDFRTVNINDLGNNRETFEYFSSDFDDQVKVRYAFRHKNGKLFTCIANKVPEARERRNIWLEKQDEIVRNKVRLAMLLKSC